MANKHLETSGISELKLIEGKEARIFDDQIWKHSQ